MFRDILLPVDLDETAAAETAFGTAVDLARRLGGRVHVVAVVPGFPMSMVESFFPEGYEGRAVQRAEAQLDAFLGPRMPGDVPVLRTVAHGRPHAEILRVAAEVSADLIVVAADRRTAEGADRLEPSLERVAREAHASVLIVRRG